MLQKWARHTRNKLHTENAGLKILLKYSKTLHAWPGSYVDGKYQLVFHNLKLYKLYKHMYMMLDSRQSYERIQGSDKWGPTVVYYEILHIDKIRDCHY